MKKFNIAVIAAALSLASLIARAQGLGSEARFDIAAQDLPTALIQFSDQSGVQVVTADARLSGLNTKGVSGRLKGEEALKALLDGTGLGYRAVGDGTVALVGDTASQSPTREEGVRVVEAEAASAETGAEERQNPSVENSEGTKLEEIVVTAQKRVERLQDVPISISVLTGDDLDNSRVQGLTETLNRVPGVSAPIGALGAPQIVIRGVTASSLLLTGTTTAAYYLDSVPYGFVRSAIVPDANVYDLERIEVLRGPQGTLFGANAQSGVVRILTHDPNLHASEFKARASTSNTADGDWNYRGDLAINIPVVADKLAFRAVAGYQDLSGWIDKTARENANDAQVSNVRFKVKAQPTESLSIVASSWFSRYDASAQSIGDDNGNNSTDPHEPVESDSDTHSLRVDYDFGGVSLTSATSYLKYKIASDLDLSIFGLSAIQSAVFASEVFSQELTFNSAHEGPWRWTLGGGYRDVEDEFIRTFNFPINPTDYSDTSQSWAVFGELTRLFLGGQLELTAGLRYFEDDQGTRENISITGDPTAPLLGAKANFDALTPRAVVAWHPRGNLTVYASYAEGFRSGVTQNPEVLAIDPTVPPLDADRLHNYEIGSKGSMWNGRVQYDSAIFYLDWKKVQQNLAFFHNGVQQVALINSGSASGVGFEASLLTTPVDNFDVGISFSWNGLTFDNDVLSGGDVLFRKGARLISSPEYTVGVTADYSFPLPNSFKGQFSTGANYTSKQEDNTLSGGLPAGLDGGEILIARAGFSVRAPEHWTTTLFVDNINNERDATSRILGVPDWAGRNTRPRTIGLQLDYRF